MEDHIEPSAPWIAQRWDVWITLGLGLLFLGVLVPSMGIWEPWEAEQAVIVDDMRQAGSWFAALSSSGKVLPELPYRWWPLLASTTVFGINEIGLRLPSLLVGMGVLLVLMLTVRPLYGRVAAYLSVLAALCMPLFVFHSRHAFGLGVGTGMMAIAALSLIRRATDEQAGMSWDVIGGLALAASGLTLGTVGVIAPAAAGLVARWYGPTRSDRDLGELLASVFPTRVVIAGVVVAIIVVGWVVAALHTHVNIAALLLWIDPIEAASTTASPPTFEQFVLQIGFGLFPLSALLPLAFASMLWAEPPSGEPPPGRAADAGVGVWFLVAFIGPALAAPITHGAWFLGAPAAAVAVGVYLARALRQPPQPLLVAGAVLLLLLVDRNLKMDTHYLGDAIVGQTISGFPAQLAPWKMARALNALLIGLLVLFQAGVRSRLVNIIRTIAYPQRQPRLFSLGVLIVIVAAGLGIHMYRPDWLTEAIAWVPLRRVLPPVRRVLILLACGLVAGIVAYVVWRVRYWWLRGRQDGRLTTATQSIADILHHPNAPSAAAIIALSLWVMAMNLPIAHALTENFSQKGLVSLYREIAAEGEPLYKYRVDRNTASFYARSLEEMSANQFRKAGSADERFFAIIPRPRLAAVNAEFRRGTQRTLPVIDATSSRFLLVSNLLGDQKDQNPITQALVESVPAQAKHRDTINFDNKIELAGWALDPPKPKAGSPLTITMYWKVLKPLTGNWKVFVHIDAAGVRIHGDHDPVEGLYPTTNWAVGDLVRDVHYISSVKSTATPGRYTFYAGLFRGSTRMKVESGPKDQENRANLGSVRVR